MINQMQPQLEYMKTRIDTYPSSEKSIACLADLLDMEDAIIANDAPPLMSKTAWIAWYVNHTGCTIPQAKTEHLNRLT